MRFISVFCALVSCGVVFSQSDDPVLFSVDNVPVHVSEFTYIYEKNNAEQADYSEQSLREYLDLYIKFKAKVLRARQMGLDTVTILKEELEGYRKQLARSYLRDKEISRKLVDEIIDRMQTDISVSHIFTSAEPKSSPEKEKRARERIYELYNRLNMGAAFDDLARSGSEDKVSSLHGGNLGYYTAPLPDGFYEFENAMCTTAPGKYSKPVRSKMGFHIIKVHDKRLARGRMDVSHIMVKKEKNGIPVKHARSTIDSLHAILVNGGNFEGLAVEHSEDPNSSTKGGRLGYFGINQFETAFEDAAFGLQNDGDFSKPVETSIGYHIIKRNAVEDNSDINILRKKILARIKDSDRFESAEKAIITKSKVDNQFKENREVLNQFIAAQNDTFYSYRWTIPEPPATQHLMSIGNDSYTLDDFCGYLKTNVRTRMRFNKVKPINEAVLEMYQNFTDEKVMAFEEENLENKYSDFKALMREYREGILLFEITKSEVWDKASRDTTGLKAYFEQNRDRYKWDKRVRVTRYSVHTNDKSLITRVYNFAAIKNTQDVLAKFQPEEGKLLYTEQQILHSDVDALKSMELEQGSMSALSKAGDVTEFFVIDEILPPSLKTLEESRGYVIADYQDELEKNWIAELLNTYTVDVDEKVLSSLIK